MSLVVLTSLFNCEKNSIRHRHYKTFQENLGIPLYTVELAFDDFPFLLEPSNQVLQIRCKTWVWQRDRIVNRLLEMIPTKYDNIALIDADILFHDPKWHIKTESMLRECKVGQVWEHCHHTMGGIPPDRGISNRDKGTVHTGYAWAARRSFLEKFGLFDRSLIGGNDVLMTCAYCGWKKHPWLEHHTEAFLKHFNKWALPVLEATGGMVGYVEGNITHMWHGSKEKRNYVKRIELLKDFDPEADIAIDENGCWKWVTDKPEMHKGIEDYMRSRLDG